MGQCEGLCHGEQIMKSTILRSVLCAHMNALRQPEKKTNSASPRGIGSTSRRLHEITQQSDKKLRRTLRESDIDRSLF